MGSIDFWIAGCVAYGLVGGVIFTLLQPKEKRNRRLIFRAMTCYLLFALILIGCLYRWA